MTDSDTDVFSEVPPLKKLPLNPAATDQSSSTVQLSLVFFLINLALKGAITNNLVIDIIYCKKIEFANYLKPKFLVYQMKMNQITN